MSNILHKVSEKLTGHDYEEDRDEYGNPLSDEEESRERRDDDAMRTRSGQSGREFYTGGQESAGQTLPSQHMSSGQRDVHSHGQQSKEGGYSQQRSDMQQGGGNFDMFQKGQGLQSGSGRMRGQTTQKDAWDEEEDDADTERNQDPADEFQKRYW